MVASLFIIFYLRCRGIHPTTVSTKKEIHGSTFSSWPFSPNRTVLLSGPEILHGISCELVVYRGKKSVV